MNCFDLRSLRVRSIMMTVAMVLVVGLPFLGAQYALFGPSNRLLPLVTAHVRLSANGLTVVLMAAYCLLLCAALLAGHRFLNFSAPLSELSRAWVYCGHDNPHTSNGENSA